MAKKAGRKAVLAAVLAAFMMAALPVYAASGIDDQQLHLSISKDAEYTMSIPATTNSVTFGEVDTVIGSLSIDGNIGTKQKVHVGVTKTDFAEAKDNTNKIPFTLKSAGNDFSSADWDRSAALAKTAYELTVNIPTETWAGKAPGSYTATLTFKAELQDVAN